MSAQKAETMKTVTFSGPQVDQVVGSSGTELSIVSAMVIHGSVSLPPQAIECLGNPLWVELVIEGETVTIRKAKQFTEEAVAAFRAVALDPPE